MVSCPLVARRSNHAAFGLVPALLASVLLVLTFATPTRVVAQARAQEAEARSLFEEGTHFAEGEHWVEALDAFRRSRAVSERPTTIFNIATTLIRLGRAQEAIATIDELERVANTRQHARILADAAEIRRQAEASLRHVTLHVEPITATIDVDGQVLAGEGAERTATLDPGAHAVVVSADGYQVERFSLEPGVDSREITLAPLDATLRVVPSVETALVTIDGTERGTGTIELGVPPGSHAVGITAEGYLPFDRSVELAPGATLTVDATLEIIPPETDITASPIFWGALGGGVAVLAGVGIALGVVFGSTTEPAYGGTSDTVIVPLMAGPLP